MKTVLATGVFDGLHAGHVHFFKQARKHGDRLVVVVAHDTTARKFGKNLKYTAKERAEAVAACRYVDKAVIGNSLRKSSIFDILREIRPDAIALGFDQRFDPDYIKKEAEKRGHRLKVVSI